MLFNSIAFLYGFLPITYLVFWRLKTTSQRHVWLTLTGYAFYSFWDYRFCALMAFSTLVSYLAGLGFLRWDRAPRQRRLCLVLPIVLDLSLLGFFKYGGLFLESGRSLAALFGYQLKTPALNIILPIGISFYTFHTISYVVDSYRRVITPTRNFFEFSCYVSLFCQLVAGPIVRFRQIEADLENIGLVHRRKYWNRGWSFFVIGLLKKVLLADTIARLIDPALTGYHSLSTASAWLVVLGYSYQLYFDFSGYSDMAVGLGFLFGLNIPQNFNSPYKSADPSDFWRRWHISLSTCMRDYVYIPLGGNRTFPYRNLFLTMLIGGMWHGAQWTFLAWGAYHGILLCLYKRFAPAWDGLNSIVRRVAMFALVVIGWVFFRATSFGMAGTLLRKMFTWETGAPLVGRTTLFALVALCTLIAHAGPNTWELKHEWRPVALLGLAGGLAICLILIYAGGQSPFLYFQF